MSEEKEERHGIYRDLVYFNHRSVVTTITLAVDDKNKFVRKVLVAGREPDLLIDVPVRWGDLVGMTPNEASDHCRGKTTADGCRMARVEHCEWASGLYAVLGGIGLKAARGAMDRELSFIRDSGIQACHSNREFLDRGGFERALFGDRGRYYG